MAPPHRENRIGISHFYRIPVTLHPRQAFVVSVGFINDISLCITHECLPVNITDGTTFHQLHGITRGKAGRPVHKLFQFLMQFDNFILIGRKVQCSFPHKIPVHPRSSIQCQLPSFVLYIAGIDIAVCKPITGKSRQLEELVTGIRAIISGIDA